MDYINLLHASGMYEKQTAKIIPFRSIDIFENAVSAGTGNFLVDGPKETVRIDESILPEDTTFGVRISGDSMEPEFHDGQIAWVLQQESVANGEIGIFALNGASPRNRPHPRRVYSYTKISLIYNIILNL